MESFNSDLEQGQSGSKSFSPQAALALEAQDTERRKCSHFKTDPPLDSPVLIMKNIIDFLDRFEDIIVPKLK